MKVEMKPNLNDTWDLIVDGKVGMEGESYSIVDAVRGELANPEAYREVTEAIEIADSIRRQKVRK